MATRGTALDQEAGDTLLGQDRRASPGAAPRTPRPRAGSSSTPAGRRRAAAASGARVNSQNGLARGTAGEPARRLQPQPAVEHHPHRRALLEPGQAAGEHRVVGQGGAAADQDGVVAQAQPMALGPCRGAGDPLAVAGGGGDPAVGTGGELERHLRPACAHPREEAGVEPARLGLQAADLDRDAGGAQPGDALAVDARVGVDRGHHRAGDAGGEHEVGAGRGAAVMGAGLEGDVGGAAAGGLAGAPDRLALGMRAGRRAGSSRARPPARP